MYYQDKDTYETSSDLIFVHKNTLIKRHFAKIKNKIQSEIGQNSKLALTSIDFVKKESADWSSLVELSSIKLDTVREEDTPQSLIKSLVNEKDFKLYEDSVFTDKKLLMFNNNETIIVTPEKVTNIGEHRIDTMLAHVANSSNPYARKDVAKVFLKKYWWTFIVVLCLALLIESKMKLLESILASENDTQDTSETDQRIYN